MQAWSVCNHLTHVHYCFQAAVISLHALLMDYLFAKDVAKWLTAQGPTLGVMKNPGKENVPKGNQQAL